ncbi:MAG: hypothetical protein CMD90_02250 [Gammaproteobacteria bacterium]|nr:hypothetical protein [Gammaproteobacteria bacterium]
MNNIKKIIVFSSIIMLAVFLSYYFYKEIPLHIEKVKVDGNLTYINKDNLNKVISENIKEKGFFDLDAIALKEEIEETEWVRITNIKKIFPNKLHINIIEHVPVAIWNDSKLINNNGEVFIAKINDTKMTKLYANKDSRSKDLHRYLEIFRNEIKVRKIDFLVKQIKENPERSVIVEISTNKKIFLGNKDIIEKINRFFKAYSLINRNDIINIKYFDMRYSNGFSVGWNK